MNVSREWAILSDSLDEHWLITRVRKDNPIDVQTSFTKVARLKDIAWAEVLIAGLTGVIPDPDITQVVLIDDTYPDDQT